MSGVYLISGNNLYIIRLKELLFRLINSVIRKRQIAIKNKWHMLYFLLAKLANCGVQPAIHWIPNGVTWGEYHFSPWYYHECDQIAGHDMERGGEWSGCWVGRSRWGTVNVTATLLHLLPMYFLKITTEILNFCVASLRYRGLWSSRRAYAIDLL